MNSFKKVMLPSNVGNNVKQSEVVNADIPLLLIKSSLSICAGTVLDLKHDKAVMFEKPVVFTVHIKWP